ncbi:MAG: hypothetical protein AAF901_14100 [Bacteroidota bacterium]
MKEVILLTKKGREYWGDIVDSKICIKSNGKTLYYSSDSVQLNLSISDSPQFFVLSADNGAILFLENNLRQKKQCYIIIDLIGDKAYPLGYFQDKKTLNFIRKFEELSRNDVMQELELKRIKGDPPKSDIFRKNIFEVLGVNGWLRKDISIYGEATSSL